jgi:plastocyanin
MSSKTNSNSNNNDDNNSKRKLLILALWAFIVIIIIAPSVVVYTLAQNSSYDSMSNKLNPDKTAYNITTTPSSSSSSWEEHNTTTSLTGETFVPNKEITLIAERSNITIKNVTGREPIVVPVWTFNGTVPGPTLRFTEGENITIRFINKDDRNRHTIHFHGNHDDKNDGVHPEIAFNETYHYNTTGTYLYNITAEPAGALMYHCHAIPTSNHIRMGMYGAMIIDPKEKPLEPAREFVMVMSEYNNELKPSEFIAKYYLNNGYYDQYMEDHPLELNNNEMLRFYIINIGISIPYAFHLHSTTFNAYPSGLLSNGPIHVQTIPVAPGDATIVEAKWKYPGYYLFHSHGFQEENGNMGMVHVKDSGNKSTPLTKSVSMFDWQYELQKKLQKVVKKGNETITSTPINISISEGAIDPNVKPFDPLEIDVPVNTTVRWTNNDNIPHSVKHSSTPVDPMRRGDSGYLNKGESYEHKFDTAGTFNYFCPLHEYMKGTVIVR